MWSGHERRLAALEFLTDRPRRVLQNAHQELASAEVARSGPLARVGAGFFFDPVRFVRSDRLSGTDQTNFTVRRG